MPITIRDLLITDLTAVAALLPDLGYAASSEELQSRYAVIATRPDQGFFVAEAEDCVIGWVHVYGVRLLESEGYAEIGGLVVAETYQRRGVGSQLVRRAELWAAEQGYWRVRLRSGEQRTGAHVFYQALGYLKAKASYAFERRVRDQKA